MNSLSELLKNLTVELHPKLAGQPKSVCISAFASRLSKEDGVFFQKSRALTIRGVTVTPDFYITLPEEGFVHVRCEILSENYDDDIMSYDQFCVYKKLAGIPCYIIKFESSCDTPHIRVVKNDDIFRHIFEAGAVAQFRGGMKLTKLSGTGLKEINQSKILKLFEKDFCNKLAENAKLEEKDPSSSDFKIVDVLSPSKMTIYLTVENRDRISGLESRQLLIKFGKREGPTFRFIMDSDVLACIKQAAAATMRNLGIGTEQHSKEVYFRHFCELLASNQMPHRSENKLTTLLFQKRENYIYIYSPSVALVIIKKKGDGSHILNVYKYLIDEYKNVRGVPGLEIVFGTDHPGNFNLNVF